MEYCNGFTLYSNRLLLHNPHRTIWLLPLGIHPATFFSVDYEPIFPWFGVVLIGMGLGE